ncbi:MAG: cupin domain-containing protein [Anaerolineae bacterium]|nr:cupin domain-containing protein [Anaerolineae bacterium]
MQHLWNVAQLAAEQPESYGEFLRIPAMSLGVYKLPAGGVDPQQPHTEDEAYYVVSGRATIAIEGRDYPVRAGDVIFVQAHAPHKFKAIEEDLTLLVFFAPAEGTQK